ncbi:hypothetical protein L198_03142 [Cryptococcus wingfieldii CBS 7118]|uniref:Uncharacterized protein n=1 Tax=Cryptococcus wingfieldii CBS 7118 TaxID=1295528 RepID=A0A1E3JIZ4_9TREE|nr:hypothetical protein L198_03142 [Cryptococcus wingfieldii CBS 7118]ODO00815.1 hypothetical protein L198_03142 [Cryptococcus wingfieldii CBS 7118]
MPTLPPRDSHLEQVEGQRKLLARATPQDLIEDPTILDQALKTALNYGQETHQLKHLELLLAILRRISSCLEVDTKFQSIVSSDIAPEFQPGGLFATIVANHLDHPLKVQQTRSTEVLSAAGQLAARSQAVSASSNFMVHLFQGFTRSDLSSRANMSALHALLPYMPTRAIPSKLLEDLEGEVSITHNAGARCALVSDLLLVFAGVSLLPLPKQSLSPEQQDALLLRLSTLLSKFQPHGTLANVTRYLLPRLFTTYPSLFQPLLSLVGPPEPVINTWVAIAFLGVSNGLVEVEHLPRDEIRLALESDDADTRLRAFDLVTGKKAYTEGVLQLIKESFVWNEALPSAGSRSAFSSATYAFFVRLHQYITLLHRNLRRLSKQPSTPEALKDSDQIRGALVHTDNFHSWFLAWIDENLWHARRYPVFRVLLALNLLSRYLDVFGSDEGKQERVFTQSRVEQLLACQASEFTEVRSRSRKILDNAKIPLPAYDTPATPSSRALLHTALESICHPRKTQAETGKAALCILFGVVLKHSTEKEALGFVQELIDKLEATVEIVQRDLTMIETHPLHGLLGGIRDVLHCLNINTLESQSLWTPIFHQLFRLTSRVWNVTRAVISLSPTKLTSIDEEGAGKDAHHEIARAYEVLGGGEDGEDEEGIDHTGLLSGCWRATMSAGELLSSLIVIPISQDGVTQMIWSRSEVDSAGQTFLVWMHEIRHRGTFSKLASAFALLVEAVRPIDALADLCQGWLGRELETISSDGLSTTRRSAALPYSILAIVSGSELLLERALLALLDFARVDNNKTSNVTKVHAFNVLKIVLLDAKQTKWFDVWFERGVITSLRAFESPDWNVRNVGLILFSTLVHRCLSPPRGGQDYYRSRATLASRTTFSTFHSKFPLILPCLIDHLSSGNTAEADNKHTPLFPILIIIRSLRWSEKNTDLPQRSMRVLSPYLHSREHQVRRAAAQALSSVLSPEEALQRVLETSADSMGPPNAAHGQTCLIHQLVENQIQWDSVTGTDKEAVGAVLLGLVKEHLPGLYPIITAESIACVESYLSQAKPDTSALQDLLVREASEYLESPTRSLVPGEEFRLAACANAILSHSPSALDVLSLLGPHSAETVNLIVLERLPQLENAYSTKLLNCVLTLAITGQAGDAVSEKALDALAETDWKSLLESWREEGGRLESICQSLETLLVRSKCIPVKEAALAALGWVVHMALGNDPQHLPVYDKLASRILCSSQEDEATDPHIQSQPARYAAYKALSYLGPHLASWPSPKLHQALLRLVQDDDEEIRQGAAAVIVGLAGREEGVVQQKAVEIWYAWAEQHLLKFDGDSAQTGEWVSWLHEVSTDRQGASHDSAVLAGIVNNDILFGVEPPNIFRDPLVDVAYASRLLNAIGIARRSDGHDLYTALSLAPEKTVTSLSPIDDAWEARKSAMRRGQTQSRREG